MVPFFIPPYFSQRNSSSDLQPFTFLAKITQMTPLKKTESLTGGQFRIPKLCLLFLPPNQAQSRLPGLLSIIEDSFLQWQWVNFSPACN